MAERDKDQVRRIIDVALGVAADSTVSVLDKVTRLRAAKQLAKEAGLVVWIEELDKWIERISA